MDEKPGVMIGDPGVWECRCCGNIWKGRQLDSAPVQCPKCKRTDWQSPRRIRFAAHCNKCGHDWNALIEHPKLCPVCKNPWWNEPGKLGISRICLECAYYYKLISVKKINGINYPTGDYDSEDRECQRHHGKPIANKCRMWDPRQYLSPKPVPGELVCNSCEYYSQEEVTSSATGRISHCPRGSTPHDNKCRNYSGLLPAPESGQDDFTMPTDF